MSVKIERIIGGSYFPYYDGKQTPAEYERAVEEHAERMHRCGVTHVMVNQTAMNIAQVMMPENPYFDFCSYGAGPDRFVTSSYNVGIFAEEALALNRRMLMHNVELARKFGFRCAMRCVEPIFMFESFFQRHPSLRGPRIDNPACSTVPVFALCPMQSESQDHYRQLMHNLLELAPDIDELHIFTNDSGGGICHSTHLYSGPNGPCHCSKIPPGQQAQVFCKTLVEGGRTVNPEFRVVMTSGLSPKEKKDFAKDMPDGVASSVYGAFAWGAGLEDYWGTQAVGPKVYGNPDERAKVRAWQYADYEARVRQIRDNGGTVYANYCFGGYYAGDDPRPFETHEIVCQMMKWDVSHVIGGASSTADYSINTAMTLHAMEHGIQPTEQVVNEIAAQWVGAEMAPALVDAWRLTDTAAREVPMPNAGHLLQVWVLIRHMPIVPDETQLAPGDLDYFRSAMQTYDTKMNEQQGGVWRILHYGQELKEAYLRQYNDVYFPLMEKAIGIFDGLLARPNLTAQQQQCLQEQRNSTAGALKAHRHYFNWIAASLHRMQGEAAPAWVPSLKEIITREIALYAATDEEINANPRLRLMRAHINDPAQRIDLSAFPLSVHLGTAGWEGAHEVEA